MFTRRIPNILKSNPKKYRNGEELSNEIVLTNIEKTVQGVYKPIEELNNLYSEKPCLINNNNCRKLTRQRKQQYDFIDTIQKSSNICVFVDDETDTKNYEERKGIKRGRRKQKSENKVPAFETKKQEENSLTSDDKSVEFMTEHNVTPYLNQTEFMDLEGSIDFSSNEIFSNFNYELYSSSTIYDSEICEKQYDMNSNEIDIDKTTEYSILSEHSNKDLPYYDKKSNCSSSLCCSYCNENNVSGIEERNTMNEIVSENAVINDSKTNYQVKLDCSYLPAFETDITNKFINKEYNKEYVSPISNISEDCNLKNSTNLMNEKYNEDSSNFLNEEHYENTSNFLNVEHNENSTNFLNEEHNENSLNFLNEEHNENSTNFLNEEHNESSLNFLNEVHNENSTNFLNEEHNENSTNLLTSNTLENFLKNMDSLSSESTISCITEDIEEEILRQQTTELDGQYNKFNDIHDEFFHSFDLSINLLKTDKEDILKTEVCTEDDCISLFVNNEEFQCSRCSLTFSSARTMAMHKAGAHGGMYIILCDGCGRLFNRKYHFNRHFNLCGRFKGPYKCDICLRIYKHRSSLVQHLKTIHKIQYKPYTTVYTCSICNKRYSKLGAFENHVERHEKTS
ncbi:uncharacterized protein LOC144470228 [Augochlora pura]